MKVFSLFIYTALIAAAGSTAFDWVNNGYSKADSDPKAVKISVIDSDKANKLFKTFASDKEIPFRYPVDGCYARATVMAQLAEHEGIQVGKVFVEGSLQVKTNNSNFPKVRWGWHVAPMVYVKEADGSKNLKVFDPSIFDHPVTVDEWEKKLLDHSDGYNAKIQSVYYSSRFQYFPRWNEGNKAEWVKHDLDESENVLKMFMGYQSSFPVQQKNHQQNSSTK
jgi:hypothetical protein